MTIIFPDVPKYINAPKFRCLSVSDLHCRSTYYIVFY